MRFSIFWRVFLPQALMIGLLLTICLYTLLALNYLSRLRIERDDISTIFEEQQRLRTILWAQMRSADQFIRLRRLRVKTLIKILDDPEGMENGAERIEERPRTVQFIRERSDEAYTNFKLGSPIVEAAFGRIAALSQTAQDVSQTSQEKGLFDHIQDLYQSLLRNADSQKHDEKAQFGRIRGLYQQYAKGLEELHQQDELEDLSQQRIDKVRGKLDQFSTMWDNRRAAMRTLRKEIIADIDFLIGLRKDEIAKNTTVAHDHAKRAAWMVGWLAIGSLTAVVLLSYLSARAVSRPLRKLARELHYVGTGQFRRSLRIRAPKEVAELAGVFNWMAARLAELDKMKADFIAHVSHELRTPLTALHEGTALLLEEIPGRLTSAQREILEVVRSHGERLFSSISSMLDLSKMEAGMMEYARVPSELPPLITRSVETVQLIAQNRSIELTVAPMEQLPLLSLDEQRIQQVLDNLLINAVKFTPSGGQIQVSARLKKDQAGQEKEVEVCVTDTGQGIETEDLERVFDRFYQSSRQPGESLRGSGLGLSIARYIVEAHGGRIWVESEEDQGSTFVFTLPVETQNLIDRPAQPLSESLANGVSRIGKEAVVSAD